MTLLVGIDGGGTSTKVVIGDANGEVLGEGRGPSGNLHDVGAERLEAHVAEAWGQALADAGLTPDARADRVLCAMASVVSEAGRRTVRSIVDAVGIADAGAVDVETDLVAALAAAHGGEPGVVLIAGTGSSCLGRDPGGRFHRSGGWGSLLDDVGSATWIGTQALVAAIRCHDGRDPYTCLREDVLARFGLEDLRQVLVKVDAEAMSRAERAGLASLVTGAAEDGDPAATEILARGADALAECVDATVKRLQFGTGSVPVAVTGGLVENVPAYRTLVHDAIVSRVPSARCVLPRTTNARGAYLECLRRHRA